MSVSAPFFLCSLFCPSAFFQSYVDLPSGLVCLRERRMHLMSVAPRRELRMIVDKIMHAVDERLPIHCRRFEDHLSLITNLDYVDSAIFIVPFFFCLFLILISCCIGV